jgi:RNA-binding protein
MTGKERAEFRAKANSIEPLFQIGKGGVTDAVIAQLEAVFNTHELIKVKILLDTCPDKPRDAARKLSAATGADEIQVIGGVIVLYRYNEELHKPKKPLTFAQKIPASKRHSITNRKRIKEHNSK